MKIRRILLRNLHSVRSEVVVDFTVSPLSEVGLFAITGDTGAGKTTILDAITLAMYGNIARKARPEEALSHGEEEGIAECEFEAKGRRFLAQWRVRTTRSKDPTKRLKTERSVAEWDEKTEAFHIIAERKVREVNALVEEATGLDFPRFTRSVLLAQGEFAAFLKASDKERSDLLERITGTEIYSELSKAALERRNIEQAELQKLTEQREALHLMSGTEEKEKKAELRSKKKEDKAVGLELKSAQNDLGRLEKIALLKKRKTNLEQSVNALEKERSAFRPKNERLAAHRKTAPLRPEMSRLHDREEEAEKMRTEIAQLTTDIGKLQTEKVAFEAKMKAAKTDFESLKSGEEAFRKLCHETEKLDEKIEAESAILAKQKNDLSHNETQLQSIDNQWLELKKSIAENDRLCLGLGEWLNQHQAAGDLPKDLPLITNFRKELQSLFSKNINDKKILNEYKLKLETTQASLQKVAAELGEEGEVLKKMEHAFSEKTPSGLPTSRHELLEKIGAEIENAGGTHERLRQLGQLDEEYTAALSEANKWESELENLRREERALDKNLLSVEEAAEELLSHLQFKQEIYRQQQLVANFAQARAELKAGEACPVCLSTEHPFRRHDVAPFVNQAKQEMEAAEAAVNSIRADQKRIGKRQAEVANAIHRIDSATEGELGKLNARALSLERKMAALLPHFGEEEFGLSHGRFLRQKLGNFEADLAAKKMLRQALSALHSQILAQEKKVVQLTGQKKELEYRAVSLRENLETQTKNFAEQKQKFELTVAELNSLVGKYGHVFSVENARAMFEELQRRETEFSEKKEQLEKRKNQLALDRQILGQLEQQKTDLTERKGKLKAEISEKENTLNQLKTSRLDKFGEKSPQKEKELFLQKLEAAETKFGENKTALDDLKNNLHIFQKTKKDRAVQLVRNEKSVAGLREKLSEKLTTSGFASLADLQAAILPEAEVEKMEMQSDNLRKRQIETERDLKNWAAEWEIAQAEPLPEKAVKELKEEIEILGKKAKEIQQSIGAIQQQLADNADRGEQAKILLESIEKQRSVFNRWNDLYDLIGSGDGSKFRKFAQGLTLQKLVQMANVHLGNLHGRYIITKRPGEDLELDIVDTFQADNVRSMHTLSGGESFLVSLALALGLSDLAGRNANICSLFIDEGFGTLDDQALDLAITTLENLQAGGKTIGVISHVKELKERISAQVRLVKKGGGVSEVEVVG